MEGAHVNGSAPASPLGNSSGEVAMLEFGAAAIDGKVVMRFDRLIQWFDMAPDLAIQLAESLITKAYEARQQKPIIVSGLPGLVGIKK